MNNYQENKQSMYLATRDYLSNNVAILEPLPNFNENFSGFMDAITQIQSSGEQQSFKKMGIAVSKSEFKKTVIALAADAARKLTAFAKFSDNKLLLGEVSYTESDLKRCPDTTLCSVAQGIYDRAQSNLAELTAYGITADSQASLDKAIKAFSTSIPKPRLGITEKKQTTKQLSEQFKLADSYLNNIDTAIEIIRLSQPKFYGGYRAARKLIRIGSGTLAVKGAITDALSGEPLKGVKLLFVSDDGVDPFEKETADRGGFMIRALQEGTYKVKVYKEGYRDKEITISVGEGEMTKLELELERS